MRLLLKPVAGLILLMIACTKPDIIPSNGSLEPQTDTLSSKKEILLITFTDNSRQQIIPVSTTIVADSFKFVFPLSSDITELVPSIHFEGAMIDPGSGVQQDFSKPVKYTVTAEDSSQRSYVVVAKVKAKEAIYFGSSDYYFYALDSYSQVIWKYHTPNGYFVYSNPTLSGNTIFTGNTDGHMYAFDATTGVVKWKFFTDATGIESPPTVYNGTVYFGSNDDKLYAVDENSGELKWSYQTGSNVSTKPVIYQERVIFGSSDANVYALNATTGELVWVYSMGDMANQSSPALHDGVVFIGSRDSYLHAIDAATGNLKWKFNDGPASMEMCSPVVYEGKVLIGSWYSVSDFQQRGSMYAVDEQTGQMVWKALDDLAIGADPHVADGRVYIAPDDGRVHALDVNTGADLWSFLLYANGATPVVSDNIVFIGGGGTGFFYALNGSTGSLSWKFPVPNGIMTSAPLIVSEE